MSDRCKTCGTGLKPLFTSMYCPNERCGRPPVSDEWRAMLPKLPTYPRMKAEESGAVWGGVFWYACELHLYVGTMWRVSLQLRREDLLRSVVAFRVNPDGSLAVIKNRHGGCHVLDVPDA